MKKSLPFLCLLLITALLTAGCSPEANPKTQVSPVPMTFDAYQDLAKGSTVNFYMWGGDPGINKWIDTVVTSAVKEQYGVTLNRVPMNAEDFMSKLISEKNLEEDQGSIDLLWINGENFYAAKEHGLLFGPLTPLVPNVARYMDVEKPENTLDFGYQNEGYEIPYGRAQFVFVYDSKYIPAPPKNLEELVGFIKANPGRFTYPAPPDFTGSAFVRNILYNTAGGYEKFMTLEPTDIPKATQATWSFLKDLKPFLWREGKTYPANIAQLDTMLADGEIWMSMTYMPLKPAGDILKGVYPDTVKTFILEEGTISNTHFLAVPQNAKNRAGAIMVANYLASFEAQLSKLDPSNWGDLPVFDMSKLSAEERTLVESLDLGSATLSQEILSAHRVPEIPARLVPIIEEEWTKNVAQ